MAYSDEVNEHKRTWAEFKLSNAVFKYRIEIHPKIYFLFEFVHWSKIFAISRKIPSEPSPTSLPSVRIPKNLLQAKTEKWFDSFTNRSIWSMRD